MVPDRSADVRGVVLVEGESDRQALETLAERRGTDLVAHGIAVVALGGASNIGRFLQRFGPRGQGIAVGGLLDAAQFGDYQRGLDRAGLGRPPHRAAMESLGFYVCAEDLEDELIRRLGPDAVHQVLGEQGESASFLRFQRQPAQRWRPLDQQLRRFLGTRSGRKIRYGRLLVEALDIDRVPQPLDRVLTHIVGASRAQPARPG